MYKKRLGLLLLINQNANPIFNLLIKIMYSFFFEILMMWSVLSIHTIDWYPWLTSQLITDQHPDLYSVPTWLTLNQESVSSQLNVNPLICINWKLVDQPNRLSTEILIKCGSSVNQGVDGAAIDYQSSIAQEYWSRVYQHSTVDASRTHDPETLGS